MVVFFIIIIVLMIGLFSEDACYGCYWKYECDNGKNCKVIRK